MFFDRIVLNSLIGLGSKGIFMFPGQRVLRVFPFVYVFFGFCH